MENIKPTIKNISGQPIRPAQPAAQPATKPAQPATKPAQPAVTATKPAASAPAKPADKPAEKPAAKPAQLATKPATSQSPIHKPTTSKKAKKSATKNFIIAVIAGALLVAAIVAIIIAIANNNGQPSTTGGNTTPAGSGMLTEEDKKVTQETMKEIEIGFDGYQHIDDGVNNVDAVVVNVKYNGSKNTNIAIEVAAKDGDTVLDTSSLYIEGVEPGREQKVYLFVYSELTADQLAKAKYEVYKAYTYTTGADENTEENTNTEEEIKDESLVNE